MYGEVNWHTVDAFNVEVSDWHPRYSGIRRVFGGGNQGSSLVFLCHSNTCTEQATVFWRALWCLLLLFVCNNHVYSEIPVMKRVGKKFDQKGLTKKTCQYMALYWLTYSIWLAIECYGSFWHFLYLLRWRPCGLWQKWLADRLYI